MKEKMFYANLTVYENESISRIFIHVHWYKLKKLAVKMRNELVKTFFLASHNLHTIKSDEEQKD